MVFWLEGDFVLVGKKVHGPFWLFLCEYDEFVFPRLFRRISLVLCMLLVHEK